MNRGTACLVVILATCLFNTSTKAQWVKTPLPNPITYVYSIVASGSNLFTGVWGRDVGCVFLSTNTGVSWTAVNSGYPGWVDALVVKGTDIFAATYGHGIFRSTDDGISWTAVSSGLRDGATSNVGALAVSGSSIFAVCGGDSAGTHGASICLSTNNGTSWTGVSSGLPDTDNINTLIFPLAVSGTNIYVSGLFPVVGSMVYRSTNNGTNWTPTNYDFNNGTPRSLATVGSNVFAGTDIGRVLLSKNNGSSWSLIASGLAGNNGVYALQAVNSSNLFAGTASGGNNGRVFLLTDNGTSWTTVNTGLSTNYVFSLDTSAGYLFAGTRGVGGPSGDVGAGVWRRPLSEMITSARPITSEFPLDYSLSQNYPNPFNPASTIRYGLPHTSFVTLTVFNTLGQEVAQLVNEQQQPGYHESVFRGDGLASGVYFYRLEAGSFVSVKKLLLLK